MLKLDRQPDEIQDFARRILNHFEIYEPRRDYRHVAVSAIINALMIGYRTGIAASGKRIPAKKKRRRPETPPTRLSLLS